MYVTIRITFDWLAILFLVSIYLSRIILTGDILVYSISRNENTANSIYHIQRAYDEGWQDIKAQSGLPFLDNNTLRPRQNGRHLADDIFKCIFLNENIRISIKISLKIVPKGPINNIPAMVQIMAWRRPGDKPLSEPMVVSLPTHICVARPQ